MLEKVALGRLTKPHFIYIEPICQKAFSPMMGVKSSIFGGQILLVYLLENSIRR